MRNLRFKSFFITLVAATLETALGKKCDPQTVAFSPDASAKHSLVELVARWAPLVDTLLSLVTASDDARDFASRLSDDTFIPKVTRQVNALLHATNAAATNATFSDLMSAS